MNTLFSLKSLKAWIAGASVIASPYLVNWLSSITPEQVHTTLGDNVSEAGITLIVGIAGLLAVYFTKNNGK